MRILLNLAVLGGTIAIIGAFVSDPRGARDWIVYAMACLGAAYYLIDRLGLGIGAYRKQTPFTRSIADASVRREVEHRVKQAQDLKLYDNAWKILIGRDLLARSRSMSAELGLPDLSSITRERERFDGSERPWVACRIDGRVLKISLPADDRLVIEVNGDSVFQVEVEYEGTREQPAAIVAYIPGEWEPSLASLSNALDRIKEQERRVEATNHKRDEDAHAKRTRDRFGIK